MKIRAGFTRGIMLLIVLTMSTTSMLAQSTLKKPTRPQKEKTTTTTTSRNSTTSGTNKSSQTSTSSPTRGSSSSQQAKASKPTSGSINGHEWVDLGLSVKWATCNVGASSPSDYGNYYAWGETRTKSDYSDSNSVTYGKSMGSIAGNPQYDAARANWSSTWRLPTNDEIDELIDKCKWGWTTQGGHKGYKVTGPNGNSIFLPAAGLRYGTSLDLAGEYGIYLSATPYGDDTNYACYLGFGSVDFGGDWQYRFGGVSVRPVSDSTTSGTNKSSQTSTSSLTRGSSSSQQTKASKPTSGSINGHEYVDLGLSVKWATCNVGALNPSGYGICFAWGETKTKSEYTEENSVTYGKNMGSIAGNSTYDAAKANWGSTWRLPTNYEIGELISKCKREWTTQGGHKGYKVTGPNGNSIFLPAAGWRNDSSLNEAGEHGYYWSATPLEDNADYAYGLYFGGGDFDGAWYDRRLGGSVRPVSE